MFTPTHYCEFCHVTAHLHSQKRQVRLNVSCRHQILRFRSHLEASAHHSFEVEICETILAIFHTIHLHLHKLSEVAAQVDRLFVASLRQYL